MKPSISIRQGNPADSEALALLGASSFSDAFAALNHPEDIKAYVDGAFSPTQIASELLDPDCTFLMAESNAELLGYAKLRRAIAFYQRIGFETVGSRDFLLGRDLQTDLIMQRALT